MYREDPANRKAQWQRYVKRYPEKIAATAKRYRERHKAERVAYARAYYQARKKQDPQYSAKKERVRVRRVALASKRA